MPHYFKDRVELFIALAPVVRLDHSPNQELVLASTFADLGAWLIDVFGMWDLAASSDEMWHWTESTFCGLTPKVCVWFDEGIFEWDTSIDNDDRFDAYIAHAPGTGWRNVIHYAQMIRDK